MSRWRRPSDAERAAFEGFVLQHGAGLAALARGLSESTADAEDLLQECLAKVLERWEKVAGADEPYLYARRVLVNASTTSWRRRHREQHTESAEDVTTRRGEQSLVWGARGDRAGSGVDDRLAVVGLLRGLPQRQRAVIVLRYLEDLPDPQVAELLGISPVTVRSTALRALRSLRDGSAVKS